MNQPRLFDKPEPIVLAHGAFRPGGIILVGALGLLIVAGIGAWWLVVALAVIGWALARRRSRLNRGA